MQGIVPMCNSNKDVCFTIYMVKEFWNIPFEILNFGLVFCKIHKAFQMELTSYIVRQKYLLEEFTSLKYYQITYPTITGCASIDHCPWLTALVFYSKMQAGGIIVMTLASIEAVLAFVLQTCWTTMAWPQNGFATKSWRTFHGPTVNFTILTKKDIEWE